MYSVIQQIKTLLAILAVTSLLISPSVNLAQNTENAQIMYTLTNYNESAGLAWDADGLSFNFGTVGTTGSFQVQVAASDPGCVYFRLLGPAQATATVPNPEALSAYYQLDGQVNVSLGNLSTSWCLFQAGGVTCPSSNSIGFQIDEDGVILDNYIAYTLELDASASPSLSTSWQQSFGITIPGYCIPGIPDISPPICWPSETYIYSYSQDLGNEAFQSNGTTIPQNMMPTSNTDYANCPAPGDGALTQAETTNLTVHYNPHQAGELSGENAKCRTHDYKLLNQALWHKGYDKIEYEPYYACCEVTEKQSNLIDDDYLDIGSAYWIGDGGKYLQNCPESFSVASRACVMKSPVYLTNTGSVAKYHLRATDCKIQNIDTIQIN